MGTRRRLLPLVRAHITAEEWRELGEAAFAKFSNDEKVIALGQVLDVATPNEAGTFLAKLPAGASCAVQRWRTASSQA